MKPTVQAPDFYKIGNDYVQAPLSSFFDTSVLTTDEVEKKALAILGYKAVPAEVTDETQAGYDKWMTWSALTAQLAETPANYQDGIYTQLAADLATGEYSAAPFKNPEGFNKRRVFVDNTDANLPEGVVFNTKENNETQPAVREEQYGKGDIIVDGADEEA